MSDKRHGSWPSATLSDVCTMVTVGIVIRPAQYYADNGVRCFRSLNVREDAVGDRSWVYITPAGNAANTKSRLAAGDVLIVRSGEPGVACVVPDEYSGCNCIDLIIARPNTERVLPAYLCAFINSGPAKRQIQRLQGGLAQCHLNVSAACKLRLPLPSVKEQAAIAHLYHTWNRQLDLAARRIGLASRLRRGLAQQLLTGKRRFPEFIRSSAFRRTRFGSLPADWPYLRVGDIAREVNERNGHDKPIPVLSCTKYDGLVDSLAYFSRQVFSEDTSGYKVVRRNQFAYATNHIEEGSIGLLTNQDAGLVSPMYTVFATDGRVDPPFLYAMFKTETYLHIFRVNTNGSINRRGGLRWDEFAAIRVALPSLEEQRRIAAVLSVADREIALLKQELDLLKKQKRGLMQKLLTGQIRVKV